MRAATLTGLCFFVFCFVGCDGAGSRVEAPTLSPPDAAQAAIDKYDSDGDQVLLNKELDSCGAIRRSLTLYDTDGDGGVNASEIEARVRNLEEQQIGMMPVQVRVVAGKSPVSGAKVVFEPESFLGTALKSASGESDVYGAAQIAISDDDLPSDLKGIKAVQGGIYKVRITHSSRTIPARFNTESTLGVEVALDTPDGLEDITFDISASE